jgi:hypothetical protein
MFLPLMFQVLRVGLLFRSVEWPRPIAVAACKHKRPGSLSVRHSGEVWNHAKARLSKLFVATKKEFKAALFWIMLSIQRTPELVRSFFLSAS